MLYKMWTEDSVICTHFIIMGMKHTIQILNKWNNNKINVFLVIWKRPTHHRYSTFEMTGMKEQHLCIISVWYLGRQWLKPKTFENLIWEWNGHINKVHVRDFQISKKMHPVIVHWQCLLYCQTLPSVIILIMAKGYCKSCYRNCNLIWKKPVISIKGMWRRRTYTIDWAGHNCVSALSKREFTDKHIIPSDPKYSNWK